MSVQPPDPLGLLRAKVFNRMTRMLIIKFYYRNHRGEKAIREVADPVLRYGRSPHHQGTRWFISGKTLDRDSEPRDFAVENILSFEPAAT